jgi:hypothetical protein
VTLKQRRALHAEFPTSYNCPWYTDGPLPHSPGLSTFVTERRFPTLGVGPFRYFDSEECFAEKVTMCEKASVLAREHLSQDPTLASEAEVAASYVQLLGCVHAVLLQRAIDDCATAESLDEMSRRVSAMEAAGARNVAAIKAWRRDVSTVVSGGAIAESVEAEEATWAQRVHDAIAATERTVGDIVQFCRHSLGAGALPLPGPKRTLTEYDGPRAAASSSTGCDAKL